MAQKVQVGALVRNILLIAVLLHASFQSRDTLTQFQEAAGITFFYGDVTAANNTNQLTTNITDASYSLSGNGIITGLQHELEPHPTGYPVRERGYIPLIDLVSTGGSKQQTCPNGTYLIEDTILPESITHANRKIPRVVHITSKSRCTSEYFKKNIDRWRLANHSVYYHDDAAVDRLFAKEWPEFPHIQLIMKCLVSGAAKADLWRYLVLWEYGGIYSDIDSAPGHLFNATTIRSFDDAWFIPEKLGVLAQYFMSSSPKHPLMFMTVHATLMRLMDLESVLNQYVPVVTGPGALKSGMISFMQVRPRDSGEFQRVPAGYYVGIDNRTVTVRGTKQNTNEYIRRTAVNGAKKKDGYRKMGQTHYNGAFKYMTKKKQELKNVSCIALVHRELFNASTTTVPHYY